MIPATIDRPIAATDRTAVTAPTPIDYPTQSTVGSLVIRRDGDAIALTHPPTTRRTLASIWLPAVYILGGLAAGATWWFWKGRWTAILPVIGPLGFMYALFGLYALVTAWLECRHPQEMSIADGQLSFVIRRVRDVVRSSISFSQIADVRLLRRRAPKHVLPRKWVALRLSDGRDHLIYRGTHPERVALVAILREAVKLPPDPLHENRYPPRPRWSRAKLQLWPDGVWITIRPRPVNLLLTILATPVAVVLARWVVICMSAGKWELRWEPPASMETSVLYSFSAMLTLGMLFVLNVVVTRSRRVSVFALRGVKIELVETGYSTPINANWHLAKLVGIGDDERGQVVLRLEGEGDVPIRQRLSKVERAWMIATIKSARLLQAAQPLPVQAV